MKVTALTELPETSECLVFPQELVTVDGLRVRASREAWRLKHNALPPYLLQGCGTKNCVNPRHFKASRTPYRGAMRCRNGHVYGERDRLPNGGHRCHQCYEAQLAKDRTGGEPNWMREAKRKFCPQGHEYSRDNLYIEITKAGRRKRHCKTCVIERATSRT